MAKRNLVAHCEKGSADKLYMFCIREKNGQYTVIGKWGRRGRSNLQQQIKLSTTNEADAVAEQTRLFNEKLKKGYVDIESPAYTGSVTMASRDIAVNLEIEAGGVAPTKPMTPAPPKKTPKAPKPIPVANREHIVECLDNLGMEDKFDARIEYVAETHEDPTLVWVFDKFGDKQECFSTRFKEVAGV